MRYADYPRPVAEDIARLRGRIEASSVPGKITDRNLLIGTWNLRNFGPIHESWEENERSPKRNLRAMASIVEIVRQLDVIAIQEVKRDLAALRTLHRWLGPDWGLILTDVTAGPRGNAERLAFVFDRRRVHPSGLAGEIVLPPTAQGDPVDQFARTPYAVGFHAGSERFVLVTAHIYYGRQLGGRLSEIRALADYVAREMRDRAEQAQGMEENLIVLGDFNTENRGDDPLFRAFTSTGLVVPTELRHIPTSLGRTPRFYDQIAWFMGAFNLRYTGQAGAIDFSSAVYPELSLRQVSYRISDHLPLWIEFSLDQSGDTLAETLGLDTDMPHALSAFSDNL